MKLLLQFSGRLLALVVGAGIALQCAAQNPRTNWAQHPENKPPKEHRQQQNQQPRPEQRQERRQQQPESHRAQSERRNDAAPRRNADTPRYPAPANPPRGSGTSRDGGNRPPNASGNSVQRPNFNGNRPPSAAGRPREFTPEERQRFERDEKRFRQLPLQQQQELRARAHVWERMTEEQRDHVRNEVLPKWKQMPPDRRQAIQQRLRVLQNMPESARNQRLNDPNFTRGMNEEDKATLRDLSHLHVGGAPDPPSE